MNDIGGYVINGNSSSEGITDIQMILIVVGLNLLAITISWYQLTICIECLNTVVGVLHVKHFLSNNTSLLCQSHVMDTIVVS